MLKDLSGFKDMGPRPGLHRRVRFFSQFYAYVWTY
jgi:hypothetical protein